jgi:hypothetical protein
MNTSADISDWATVRFLPLLRSHRTESWSRTRTALVGLPNLFSKLRFVLLVRGGFVGSQTASKASVDERARCTRRFILLDEIWFGCGFRCFYEKSFELWEIRKKRSCRFRR